MPSSDLSRLRASLRRQIVSVPPHNPEFPAFRDEVSPVQGRWPDVDYTDRTRGAWSPRLHLLRTQALAVRAAVEGDAASRETALAALDWWIGHDPLCPNWWHNQIGTPRLLANSLLLLGEHVPPALLADSRRILGRAGDFILEEDAVTRRPTAWTGANRLWISANRLLAGALFGDEDLIVSSLAAALQEIRVSPRGEEGIQVDGSFHQHGPLLYNGGYGSAFVGECLFFLECTHGTRWEPAPACRALLADFLLDGTRWMLRGADFNHGCRDREITRPHHPNTGLAPLTGFLAGAGGPRQAELQDLADSLRDRTAPGALTGNRMFYRSDFMVQQGTAAGLSVRMHSARTVRAECCNSEGKRSHHLADGLTYLLRTGAEYLDIFPVWDWQKLPGITCLQTPSPEPASTIGRHGLATTVGGVSDGRHGACLQHLQTDHLAARKGWFFGPDDLVCLGAGIHSSFAGPVVTTFDQSRVQGPVESDTTATPLETGCHGLHGVRWLRHGPWGFVFPQPTDLTLELGAKTGTWSRIGGGTDAVVTQEVFLAYANHGQTPEGATYAYAVVADADRSTLAKRAANPGFQIVANTETCQAVWRPESHLLQAAFFQPGEITWETGGILRVNRVCCVQAREESGRWELHVADVQQHGGSVELEFRETADAPVRKAIIAFPTGDEAGKSVRATVPSVSRL